MLSLEQISSIWGKTNYRRNDGQWHSLICHLLDVAACAKAILWREPPETRMLHARDVGFTDYEMAEPWILLFIALHDIGKATPSFQQKADTAHWRFLIDQLRKHNLTWDAGVKDIPHGLITQCLLSEWDYFEDSLCLDRATILLIAQAIGAHHGFREPTRLLDVRAVATELTELSHLPWIQVRQGILELLIEVLDVDTGNPPKPRDGRNRPGVSGAAFFRLMGLTSFADWLGSDANHFTYTNGKTSDYKRYFQAQCMKAEAVLDKIGWRNRVPLLEEHLSIDQVFSYLGKGNKPFKARALQTALASCVEDVEHPLLLLIEAPMGEGKTEAGFYAHLRLQAQLGHRGMYVALPTQATGNQMFTRTEGFLRAVASLAGMQGVDLQLLHGMMILNEDYQKLSIASVGDPDGGVRAHEWFTPKKRGLLSEYGVGTVDQALLAILGVIHQFVRLWGLGNRTVIIDEVHAYDSYTSGLIRQLVEWLQALGSSVILMSATLPADKRKELMLAYGAKEEDIQLKPAYPRISKVSGGKTHLLEYTKEREQKGNERNQHITLGFASSDVTELVKQAKAAVDTGGCAVVIVNTVARAQQIYQTLGNTRMLIHDDKGQICGKQIDDLEVYLFHARYPGDERKARENKVLELFGKPEEGKPSKRPRKAILIATQVVEQSLDLDFDVMFTDLAPIDLILQRAGRLWRHERSDRSVHQSKARLYVAFELEDELPVLEPQYDKKGKVRNQVMYEQYVQLLSWWFLQRDFIESERDLVLPDDIDPLVQTVYGFDESLKSLPEPLKEQLAHAHKCMEHRKNLADSAWRNVVIGSPNGSWADPPQLKRDDDVEDPDPKVNEAFRAVTRQGEPTITVIPLFKSGEMYLLEPNDPKSAVDLEKSTRKAKAIFARNIKLQREDVVKVLAAIGAPKGWSKDALLRNCFPLALDEQGRRKFWWTNLRLDLELGVVYDSTSMGGEYGQVQPD